MLLQFTFLFWIAPPKCTHTVPRALPSIVGHEGVVSGARTLIRVQEGRPGGYVRNVGFYIWYHLAIDNRDVTRLDMLGIFANIGSIARNLI
jgi:hypothetical protein